jgi:thioredoxin-dependent peroxiredoxin
LTAVFDARRQLRAPVVDARADLRFDGLPVESLSIERLSGRERGGEGLPARRKAKWSNDIKETQGYAPNYPMIGDTDLKVSKLYGMLPASLSGTSEGRTAADNMTVRNVFAIGPDKKIKLIIVYPMTTGRNFDEVLRVIDSLQLTAKHKVATPVNWKPGDDVIIAGSVSDDDAKKVYSNGWKAPRPYIRIVPQPRS